MSGALPANVMQFARVLRRAGVPIGPGKVLVALQALHSISLARRDDVYSALHCTLIDRHAQSEIFDIAFHRFWRQHGDADTPAMAVVDPAADQEVSKPESAIPRRLADAFGDLEIASVEDDGAQAVNATASWSAAERLRQQDFETMSREEMDEAARLVARLRLPIPEVSTRRSRASHTGPKIDMRATLRKMVRSGGAIALERKAPRRRHPPLVLMCDISGSMATYSRMLLRFLHAVTNDRDRVHVFLFGTRLSNVTRELAHRDPDIALARIGRSVEDWGGGTRIGKTLEAFNRQWSRRVLGQGAVMVLITDGLDRDGGEGLEAEMQRLNKSCRRLIWLNPLLRYEGFEPKSAGIKAMLPYVHEFRPAHNLDSLTALVSALSDRTAAGKTDLRLP